MKTHNTAIGTLDFVSEPPGRGTWGIALSCTLTLIFCVFTSIHLNIVQSTSVFLKTMHQLVWIFVTLVQPQGVLLVAFGQWLEARQIRDKWRKHFNIGKHRNKESEKLRKKRWFEKLTPWIIWFTKEEKEHDLAMSEAFFVVMGGFIIDETGTARRYKNEEGSDKPNLAPIRFRYLEDSAWWLLQLPEKLSAMLRIAAEKTSSCFRRLFTRRHRTKYSEGFPSEKRESRPNRHNRAPGKWSLLSGKAKLKHTLKDPIHTAPYYATLTPVGFVKYMQEGCIDRYTFSRKEIEDKGKADYFKKAVAVTQGSYLAVHLTARFRIGLPITLLEYHLMFQLGFTLLIYLFWWNKPLDAAEPIRIDIWKPRKSDAMPPTPDQAQNRDRLSAGSAYDPLLPSISESSPVTPGQINRRITPSQTKRVLRGEPRSKVNARKARAYVKPLRDEKGETKSINELIKLKHRPKNPRFRRYIVKQAARDSVSMSARGFYEIANYMQLVARDEDAIDDDDARAPGGVVDAGVLKGSNKASGRSARTGSFKGILFEVILLISAGAAHFLASNTWFPTDLEQLLWKASSIGLALFPGLVFSILALTNFPDWVIIELWNYTEGNDALFLLGIPSLSSLDPVRILCSLVTIAADPPIDQQKFYDYSMVRCWPTEFLRISKRRWLRFLWRLFLIFLCLVLWICYAFCTAYIIVECYYSLRRMPEGVYRTPRFTDYWPHF